ncbi:MAG: hypothetical protein H5U40_01925 [Polyangiaceae bacterium]|nr:hypothetical protein [Polyangiaceae bacterium]
MKIRASFLAFACALVVSGCSSSGRSRIYDTCFDVFDCEPAADACAFMSYQFGGFIYENAICTVQCFDDLDCPGSANGEPGGCYPAAIDDGFPGCVERCFDDRDCPGGFICVNEFDFAFIDPGDSICVPGPR